MCMNLYYSYFYFINIYIMDYKYLKYKNKYLEYKNNMVGGTREEDIIKLCHNDPTITEYDIIALDTDIIEHLIPVFLANTHLTKLSLVRISPTAIEKTANALAIILNNNKYITTFSIFDTAILNSDAFIQAFLINNTLTTLIFDNSQLIKSILKSFEKMLSNNNIKKLHIRFNTFTPNQQDFKDEQNLITDILAKSSTLNHLSELLLYDNNINILNIIVALHTNTTLTRLLISGNEINIECAHAIAHLLKINKHLNEIHFNDTHIDSHLISIILEGLLHNNTLKILKLNTNRITSDCEIAIAYMLAHNNTLQELYLNSNMITSNGIIAIAKSLINNNTLQELNLYGNSYDDHIIQIYSEFIDLLKKNVIIKEINLNKNYNQENHRQLRALDNELYQILKENEELPQIVNTKRMELYFSYYIHKKKVDKQELPYLPIEIWLNMIDLQLTPRELIYYQLMRKQKTKILL